MKRLKVLAGCLLAALPSLLQADPWVTYEPPAGKANGKYVVLLSGDEEYRSEEGLPQLGKILSQRHGFKCTVLFSQDADGSINPNNQTNIPGMHLLDKADLVICQFRFRELPDADMQHFVDYMEAGKPMMVLRTATHSFDYSRNKTSPFAKYSWGAKGGGFGGMTVGETWTYHHGDHGHEATRGLIEGKNKSHPILTGVKDVFGPTDVYGVNPDFPSDATVLMEGMVLKGMNPDDAPNLNKPLMPIVWLRDYKGTKGATAKFLGSTIGAATDMKSADLRRLFVNASYWLTDQKVPANADVETVGEYTPSMFGFNKFKVGVKVSEHELKP
ncbi:MAG TPA: ThuA domain-containing protein [Candidatus Limnocylindria bacterium]|nr:ThuA domain-containing protein [Candidatus Limnocylindria bacterium]